MLLKAKQEVIKKHLYKDLLEKTEDDVIQAYRIQAYSLHFSPPLILQKVPLKP